MAPMQLVRRLFHRMDTLHWRALGCSPRLVQGTVAGRPLWVREGGIRPRPDYDDAWLFCAARKARTIFDIGCNVRRRALIAPTPSACGCEPRSSGSCRRELLQERSGNVCPCCLRICG
jgi:hypothetical protein